MKYVFFVPTFRSNKTKNCDEFPTTDCTL